MGAGLDRNEKLREIGSRNFFMCPKKCSGAGENGESGDGNVTTPFASCSSEAEKASKGGGFRAFGWLRL